MTLLLVGIVVLLQLVDGWSTWHVYRFKLGYEDNPMTAHLMDRFGVYRGLFIAKAWAIVLIVGAYLLGLWSSIPALIILFVLAVYYAKVVVHNLQILYRR